MSSVMSSQMSFRSSASLAAALGVLGGTILVLFAAFFSSGKLLLLPYAVFIVATAVVLKSCRVTTYSARFGIGLASFLLASAGLYIFIATVATGHVSLLGHLWRFGLLLVIGTAIQAAVARISD
jgi:hypothetical protein